MDPDRSDYFAWGADACLSQCAYCVHLDRDAPTAACAAFPAGVPDAFLRNEADHRRPRPGDRGIGFEPRAGINPVALATLYRHLDALHGPDD